MSTRAWLTYVAPAGLVLACCGGAHAQCKDPWINNAFHSNAPGAPNRAPNGSGTTGECNPQLYAGANWSSQAELNLLVIGSKLCPDPWIGEVFLQTGAIKPPNRPTAAQCTATNYGGGHWTTYADLSAKMVYKPPQSASKIAATGKADLLVGPDNNVYDYLGNLIGPSFAFIVQPLGTVHPGGNVVTVAQASALVAQGKASMLATGDTVQGAVPSMAAHVDMTMDQRRIMTGTIIHKH